MTNSEELIPLNADASPSVPATVTKSIICNLFIARALINEVNGNHTEIEKKFGVTLTVVPGKDSGTILVKGVNEAVARASAPVQKFVDSQAVHIFEAETMHQINWLFGSGQKASMAEVRHYSSFSMLKRELGITISAGPNANPETQKQIGIAFTKGHEARAQEIAQIIVAEIIPKISWTTEVLEIPHEYNRCWKDLTCRFVSERCKEAGLVFRRAEDKTQLSKMEVWGTDSGREFAKQLINQFHTCREVDVPQECLKPLVEDRCRMITEIQDSAVVHISFNKLEKKIWIYGLPDCKDKAECLYQDFVNATFASIAHLTVKAFQLKWEEIGPMIGPKGSTINRIREQSGVEDIRIDEEEERVVFTGTENAVDIAIQMAEDELSARKEVFVLQAASDTVMGRGDAIEKKTGTKGALLVGKADGQSSWEAQPKTTEVDIKKMDMGNEELFPALGAAATKQKKFGNRKKMGR